MILRVRLALALMGVAMVALSAIVLVRNASPDDELLASVGALAGVAIVLTAFALGGK